MFQINPLQQIDTNKNKVNNENKLINNQKDCCSTKNLNILVSSQLSVINQNQYIPKGHFSKQLINCNIECQPRMFTQVKPQNHKLYISQVAKTYHKIAPIKIKNIVPKNIKMEDMPIIDTFNYFSSKCDLEKKKLCHLIPSTNILAYYIISDISASSLTCMGKQSCQQIQLPISWKFSYQTKSLVTSQGKIFAIGCKNTEDKVDRHIYEINKQKVVKKGQMPQSIREFGFISLGQNIYVISGKKQTIRQGRIIQIYSKKCFKYNIIDKKWSQISECHVALSNGSLCSFKNRFIFKLSGLNEFNYINKTIQVYDTKTDKWSLVRITPKNITQQIQFLQGSCAVQINDNQIFIFGGLNSNKFSSDSGFILQIGQMSERKDKRLKINAQLSSIQQGKKGSRNMLSSGGIYDRCCLIEQNCVYALRKDYCQSLI